MRKRPNDIRGETVRRMLLTMVRACAARDLPMPSNAVLGGVIGIDASQVCRHMNRLIDEGAFSVSTRRKRRYVLSPVSTFSTGGLSTWGCGNAVDGSSDYRNEVGL